MFVVIARVLIKHSKKKLQNMKGDKEKEQKNRAKGISKTLFSIVSVMTMFGLSWFFGAFSIGGGALVFQWLFVIFNTTQGFMLFIFFCVIGSDAREEWKNLLTCNRYRQKKKLTGQVSTISSSRQGNWSGTTLKERGRRRAGSGGTTMTSYGRRSETLRISAGLQSISEEDKPDVFDSEIPLDSYVLTNPVLETSDTNKLLSIQEEDHTVKEKETSFDVENGSIEKPEDFMEEETSFIFENGHAEKPKHHSQLPPHAFLKLRRSKYSTSIINYDFDDEAPTEVNSSEESYPIESITDATASQDLVFANTQNSFMSTEPNTQATFLDSTSEGTYASQTQDDSEDGLASYLPYDYYFDDSSQQVPLSVDNEEVSLVIDW